MALRLRPFLSQRETRKRASLVARLGHRYRSDPATESAGLNRFGVRNERVLRGIVRPPKWSLESRADTLVAAERQYAQSRYG